jgi:DNA-binding MarR family transcriptional regulator
VLLPFGVEVSGLSRIDELANAFVELMSKGKIWDEVNSSGKGELFVLKYLDAKGAPTSPSELSESLGSSAARISKVLGVLERKGQIHREINTSNRRYISVTITEAGRERITHLMRIAREHIVLVFTEMGEKNAEEFIRLATYFFETAERTMPNLDEHENRFLNKSSNDK